MSSNTVNNKLQTINHYRNITETTQNTVSIRQTNHPSYPNMKKNTQKLPKISSTIQISKQLASIKSNKNIALNKNNSKSYKYLEQSSNIKYPYKYSKYQRKNDDFQPVLSSQRTTSEKDIKQFTFGKQYYENNPQNHHLSDNDNDNKITKSISQMNLYKKKENSKKKRSEIINNSNSNTKLSKRNKTVVIANNVSQQAKIMEDQQINPIKYAIGKQMGLTQLQIYTGKNVNIEYELEKFIRKKGIQYLQHSKILGKSYSSKKILKTQPTQQRVQQISSHNTASKTKQPSTFQTPKNKKPSQKLPKIQTHRKRIKTEITTSQTTKKPTQKQQIIKQKQDKKYTQLNEKQQMLGKIVFNKVDEYFKYCKQKKHNYFTAVKSEQNIQKAWTEYLKTRVDRANYILTHQ